MSPNSLFIVITFHSLEEKLVQQSFRVWSTENLGYLGTKKPLTASEEELEENGTKSQSAKLHSFIFES